MTLHAESRDDVDVFKKKKRASFYLNFELKYWSSNLESSVNMPNYCVAVGCKNTAKKGSEYSFHCFPHQNPNLLKSGFMQFAENNGSQQNIASFVVTTFMKVALSSGQGQRVKD